MTGPKLERITHPYIFFRLMHPTTDVLHNAIMQISSVMSCTPNAENEGTERMKT
jgi:hypothetical protein